jgi:hypothetical protein
MSAIRGPHVDLVGRFFDRRPAAPAHRRLAAREAKALADGVYLASDRSRAGLESSKPKDGFASALMLLPFR